MRMTSRVDHLVLVSNDVPTTVRFYADLLQGEVVRLAEFEQAIRLSVGRFRRLAN